MTKLTDRIPYTRPHVILLAMFISGALMHGWVSVSRVVAAFAEPTMGDEGQVLSLPSDL